jgi:hypothetical protein
MVYQTIYYFCAKFAIMRDSFFVVLLLAFTACQTTKIKNNQYKISPTSPELGSIGAFKSAFSIKNNFETRTLPKLENKIRVALELVPYNKKLNKVYTAKVKYNQNLPKVVYVDSVSLKPEIATIELLDVTGFVSELNAEYNLPVFKIIDNLEDVAVVTAVAVNFSVEDIAKIKQADSYYLSNTQENKYTISLYKQAKKTDNIEINPAAIMGYRLGKFCWSETNRNKWYIADIVNNNSLCRGKTTSEIKQKRKEESLFKM